MYAMQCMLLGATCYEYCMYTYIRIIIYIHTQMEIITYTHIRCTHLHQVEDTVNTTSSSTDSPGLLRSEGLSPVMPVYINNI